MQYKYPDTAILVFCKAPVAGQVKTRLMSDLTAEEAADIHIMLSHRILALLSASMLCPIQLWCSPDSKHPFFKKCTDKYSLTLREQRGMDLGERMHHAIRTTLQTFSKVLLVGCDCPSITLDDFDSAIKALNNNHDVVFAPAEDGGYVIVGMTQPNPTLFLNMTWSNESVFRISQNRAKQLGLSVYETSMQWDVDTVEDLQRFNSSIN